LAGPPTTSDDLYRYAWDGRVQAASVDPYADAPDAPDLARLHDQWLWPDPSGCASLHRPAGCTRINRPDVRTIYPPVAEAWLAAALIAGALAVAAGRPSGRNAEIRRDVAFGLFIGAAALVKIYPGVLLFAAFGLPALRPMRSWLRATAAAAALSLVSYTPHVL